MIDLRAVTGVFTIEKQSIGLVLGSRGNDFLKSWSISLGSVAGVALRLHLSWILLAVLVIARSLEANAGGGARGALLPWIALASVILHELGHLLVAALRGQLPKVIMLLPIGGVQLREHRELDSRADAKNEIAIALAGPITSLLFAAILWGALYAWTPASVMFAKPYVTATNLAKSAVWFNLILAGVSMLPAYPLDGGRLLRVLLAWPSQGEPAFHSAEATRRVVAIAQVLSTFLMFAGIWNSWFMLVGICIFLAVQIDDRSQMFHAVVESVRLEEIMLTEFATLSPADTLADALSKAVHTLQDDFPVIRSGDLVGVINKQSIIEALRQDGDGYVQSAMQKVSEVCQKTESLAVAFRKITMQGATLIPVVDNERLVGIVTLQNVMHSMRLIAETRRLRRRDDEAPPVL